jgi:hypothetical protein
MYSLLINLYEFGQFLRIFLWITLPVAVIAMLVSTYFHYRRKRGGREPMFFAMDGFGLVNMSGEVQMGESVTEEARIGETATDKVRTGVNENEEGREEPEPNEKIYKGILWMKEKYEQYRDLADRRYELVKEELARTEKKYQDLLAGIEERKAEAGSKVAAETLVPAREAVGETLVPGREAVEETLVWTGSEADKEAIREIVKEKNRQIHFLQGQLDQRIKNYHELEYQGRDDRARVEELEKQLNTMQQSLEERQRMIAEMDGHLLIERNKVEELVAKLQDNSLLLMNIYKELDKSLHIEKPAQL